MSNCFRIIIMISFCIFIISLVKSQKFGQRSQIWNDPFMKSMHSIIDELIDSIFSAVHDQGLRIGKLRNRFPRHGSG